MIYHIYIFPYIKITILVPVCIACVVLSHKTNNQTSPKTNCHAKEQFPTKSVSTHDMRMRILHDIKMKPVELKLQSIHRFCEHILT
jgi:hypothetical protein